MNSFIGSLQYIQIFLLHVVSAVVGYILAAVLSFQFYTIEMIGKLMDTLRGEIIGNTLTQSSFIETNL